MRIRPLCKIKTDRQDVHVCLDDRVFCMGEVEGRGGGKGDSRLHLGAGSEARCLSPINDLQRRLLPAALPWGDKSGDM